MIGVTAIPLDAITVPSGRRPLRDVARLAESIDQLGLLSPITVTSDSRLVLGYHRLEACRQLGWTEIPAQIRDGDADDLELSEIDENLIRNELGPLERGSHWVRRDALLLRMEARTRIGGQPGNKNASKRNESATVADSLFADQLDQLPQREIKTTAQLAAAMGQSARSVQLDKQIATKIAPLVQDIIRDLPVATHTRDLLEIARAKPADQHAIAVVLERGNVETVREAKQVVREQAHAERDAALPAPPLATASGPFDLIYADPPWRYERGTLRDNGDAIENHYPTMDLEAIRALSVPGVIEPNCILFLWATSPKLAEAMSVIDAWGFTYRTCAVWVKDKIGLGYYFRQRHELLLVATKGSPGTPEPSDRTDSVITAPRLEHSAKPEQVYGLIEAMYPRARKAELFARNQRDGWVAWGNQA